MARQGADKNSGIKAEFRYHSPMLYMLRFLWNAARGHRVAPWRSPYLLWRIETYCGVKMTQIGFLEFWEFSWRERKNLWRFLKWTGEMEHYARPGGNKA
ncbi:MAG TPA: hypothetical protein VL156_01500 [Terriglobales bacterium]|jgi:hypothetical protein|nr:hypothetical protein [Terriglobales bacterium]